MDRLVVSGAAPAPLDAGACAALATEGYLVVAGALPPAAVAELRAIFPAPTGAHGTLHVEIGPAHAALVTTLAHHPISTAVAWAVLGRPYSIGMHGRNPRPGDGLQGLHADAPARRPGQPFDVVTAIWMLDAFTADNGATRVVPGSHVDPRPIPKAVLQPTARHPRERTVTGAAGSLLIFNGHLLHSGTRNRSAGPRRAIQAVAVAHDARYFSAASSRERPPPAPPPPPGTGAKP